MKALLDMNDHLKLWLNHDRWLVDPHATPVAFIQGNGVHDLMGHHVAQWHRGLIRDHQGQILLSDALQFARRLPRPPRLTEIYREPPNAFLEQWTSAHAFVEGLRLKAHVRK